jgi:hypothetical protein
MDKYVSVFKVELFIIVIVKRWKLSYMMAHTCNPSIQEAEAEGWYIRGQPQLEFTVSLEYK